MTNLDPLFETELKTARSCYGIIMQHEDAWWLVEFENVDTDAIAAHRLTGRLSPGMQQWFRNEIQNPESPADVPALHPGGNCWSGEFMFAPSPTEPGYHDIIAHPWGSEASEIERKLSLAKIESALQLSH